MNFCKMNGCGNDFIIIDNRFAGKSEDELSETAKILCERRMSIGADGLIAVETAQQGGDFRMRFFNADGSVGEMCGNGARCICRYGFENGLAGEVQRVETNAGLIMGERISKLEYRVLMNEPSVIEFDAEAVVWDPHAGCRRVYSCDYVELGNPGVPHAVLEFKGLSELVLEEESAERLRCSGADCDDRAAAAKGGACLTAQSSPYCASQKSGSQLCWRSAGNCADDECKLPFGAAEAADAIVGADEGNIYKNGTCPPALRFKDANDEGVSHLREVGRALRRADCFPKGANVNFYEFTGGGRIFEVTFERGVEDFTYACGSGSASAAAALALRGRLAPSEPLTRMQKDAGEAFGSAHYCAQFIMRGGELRVDVELAHESKIAEEESKELVNAENCTAQPPARIARIYLSGPTNMVACGTVHDDVLTRQKGEKNC